MKIDSSELMKQYVAHWFPMHVNMWQLNDALYNRMDWSKGLPKDSIGNGYVFSVLFNWLQAKFETEFIKALREHLKTVYGDRVSFIEVTDIRDGKFTITLRISGWGSMD